VVQLLLQLPLLHDEPRGNNLLLQQGALLSCNLRVVWFSTQCVRLHFQLLEGRHGLGLVGGSASGRAVPAALYVPAALAAWRAASCRCRL
jgi:hypothetical protein